MRDADAKRDDNGPPGDRYNLRSGPLKSPAVQREQPDNPECGAPASGGDAVLSLPIAPEQGADVHARRGGIRRSRTAVRRAWVLAAVQLLMVAHVVQWWLTGRTTTPIEPSESMEFVKRGVVNAGLIFFALALLSTLVLGRWFCGWGCHLVLLQDLCGWLMKRAGIRPRPFRSRVLVYVPLFVALYMFIWPVVYRWIIAPAFGTARSLPDWQLQAHLTTTDFWSTFAGVAVAIPFLLVCGFATVYFLGSKGFCTYGCPYGGFFAPLDRFAPARIRVNDSCEHCGHCTAVCTSNVRVHEEVRDYGMVVDPGCMKCLDCVSVCPNDALSFGLGRPAIGAAARAASPTSKRYDLNWSEELMTAAVFAAVFFALRGLYDVVPMLFAVGLAGCASFVGWKSWRVLGDRDARFHRFQLKRHGRLTAPGIGWLAGTALLFAFVVHGGLVQYHTWRGTHLAASIPASTEDAFRGSITFDGPTTERLDRAAAHLRKADSWRFGGIGLMTDPDVPVTLARLHLLRGKTLECEHALRRGIRAGGASDVLARDLARVMAMNGGTEEVIDYLEQTLAEHPGFDLTRAALVILLESQDRIDDAQRIRAARPSR